MGLEKVQEKIFKFISELENDYIISLLKKLPQGKMLRSKLIFKIAGINEKSINLAAIIELIHAASLLHDDVIDEADTRRGKPSLNALYGNKTAIMFGDILYSKGFYELSKLDSKIAQTVSNAVTLLSIGELQEIELTKNFNDSLDKYLDVIYKKTSSLIEASAKSAAILANKDYEAYAEFGKNLGIAFQMVDDILDITQDSTKLGKPAMQDFYEGKVTIPYLLLYERLDNNDKNYLKSLFKKKLNKDELSWIKDKLNSTNSLNDAISLAKEFGYKGIKAIDSEENKELITIMNDMINRDF